MYRTAEEKIPVAILTTSASPAIQYHNSAGGSVFIPAAEAVATLTWFGSYDGSTWFAAYNSAGTTAVTQAVDESRCYPIPDELFGLPFIQARGDVAGNIFISRKS